jgi:hypothetical protein
MVRRNGRWEGTCNVGGRHVEPRDLTMCVAGTSTPLTFMHWREPRVGWNGHDDALHGVCRNQGTGTAILEARLQIDYSIQQGQVLSQICRKPMTLWIDSVRWGYNNCMAWDPICWLFCQTFGASYSLFRAKVASTDGQFGRNVVSLKETHCPFLSSILWWMPLCANCVHGFHSEICLFCSMQMTAGLLAIGQKCISKQLIPLLISSGAWD